MRKVLMFVFAMCLSLFAVGAMAQTATTGAIEGTVLDPNGAVVPNATVTVTGPGLLSPRTATTDDRGHYSIAIFAVDAASGMLKPVDWEPVQGLKPRFFGLDPGGGRLYAANENSHTIVEFRINRRNGTLTPTDQIIKTGSPSCIAFKTR